VAQEAKHKVAPHCVTELGYYQSENSRIKKALLFLI